MIPATRDLFVLQGGGFGSMLPLLVGILAIFYFLVIRPQSKQNKAREEMLRNLKKNDRVLTAAGIYGTVTALGDNDVTVMIDDSQKIRVRMTRASITTVLTGEENGGEGKSHK